MKKNLLRNLFPNPLSLNASNIIQNQPISSFKKLNPNFINNRSEINKNASLDCNDMHHPNFNLNRKLSKSSQLRQRIGSYSNLMSNKNSFLVPQKNLYNDFVFQKAPSFNENTSEIHQIINKRKIRKLNYLNNLFFNSKFSNEYLDDIYKIRKNNILFQNEKNKMKLLQRNNSCGELLSLSNRINKNFNVDTPHNESSTNNSNIIKPKNEISTNINSNNSISGKKNVINNNSSVISTGTYRSINTNKFPEIYSNSNVSMNEESDRNNNVINSPKITLPKLSQGSNNKKLNISNSVNQIKILDPQMHEGNGTLITSLGVEKMKYKLNEAMFENFKKNVQINEFEKKILKLKIIQIYQKDRLEEILNEERFNIQDRIDHIVNMYNIYENIYTEYKVDLGRYINFLYLITSDFEVELEKEIKKKRGLEYDVEFLVDKLITGQKELEYLIGLRNFLFVVKKKDRRTIRLDDKYVLDASKRSQFVNGLLNIFDREYNTIATKYLKKLISIEELEFLLSNKNIKTRSTTKKITNGMHEEYCDYSDQSGRLYPPPPGEKIFDSPDDFINIIEELEAQIISSLNQKEDIRLINIKLHNELDKYLMLKDDIESIKLNEDIIDKMRYLKKLKEKNDILKKRKEYLSDLYSIKNNKISFNQSTKHISYSFLINLNYFHRINYNNIIHKYKYPGLMLLEKLMNYFNYNLPKEEARKIFNAAKGDNYLPFDILFKILRTKLDYFNDKNQYLIIEYILHLIKLYEYLCECFMRKDKQYRSLFETQYKKFNESIQNEKKIHNARLIRKLIDERREINSKKLIEKWKKKPNVMGRKLDLDIKPFYLERNLSQEYMRKKRKKGVVDKYETYKNLLDNFL